MGLSYDLISEFVKITNDKKENTKEGTVYATVVSGTGGKYVRIDGSDLLTPMDTTTDIEDGERVTLMIKDHKAIVTGNVTTPSASTSKVDKVTESVNSVSDRVGTFELVVADKVSTNELEAYKATIEVLIANKATIEDLTATNAKIENLEVKNAEIENLVAEKATIEDLEAVNATIENLKVKDAEIENAVVENLKATTADIKILNADFAQIKTLVNGNLTSDNILSFNLTSEKVTVDDAFIKDAMIDTISAGKINAGKINTNSVSIGSEDGGMLITGSTQQFTDKNGNVRIQIGKDTSGDFTFILYGEDGQGQIINQNGITASAISDGLIVNDMVSDHAAISGGKLDISSVITEINNDNSTTIQSSKIYLNDQAQSLEVAFNSLKTQVDTIQEVTIQGDLTAIVEQVQSNTSKIEANKNSINTLISEDTVIKKQVTDLQGTLSETETTLNSKYTSLNQNLDGFKTTVADTYATKKSVTDVVDNIETNYSTTSVMNSAIKQKAQEISASVSSTYATKNQVNTLDNNLKTNYSTTQEMESAINLAKEAINLGVSSIYETKENVETKVTSTLNSAKSYADTKKSEAIKSAASDATSKANTAKNDAIKSANNTLTSTIANYYTKSQTDSQINVAKEAINLGVSSIYETKENVETKVTSTLNSAKSYADTKKSEAIKSAASDATSKANTAKQEAIKSANNTLTSTIANYYTKAQTDSQINVAKEAINLGVSTTYETKENVESKVQNVVTTIENITIGGTNLIANSNFAKNAYWANNSFAAYDNNGYNGNRCITLTRSGYTGSSRTGTSSKTNSINDVIPKGTTFTLSGWVYVHSGSGIPVLDSDNSSFFLRCYKVTDNSLVDVINIRIPRTTEVNKWVYFSESGTTYVDHKAHPDLSFYISKNGKISLSQVKLEYGNKATSWTPAPEDTIADINDAKTTAINTASTDATNKANNAKNEAITSANNTLTTTIANYYTKTQTDSAIKVAKDAINLGVSQTYETKSNVESKVTSTLNSAKSYADTKKTEAINAASTDATTKATSTLNSAKSYADTKKTEAINAASTDATTKVNNAKTELNTAIGKKANSADVYTKTEVYTKAQTDSQIKVAKDAINLSVANTYETKTNVESKINGIQVGGRNYFANSNFSETTSRGETTSKHPDLYAVDWGGYNGGITNPTTSYHAHVDNDTFGYNVIEFNESDGNRNWKAVTQGSLQLRISASGTYTFSVDMFATGSGTQIYGGFYYTQKNGTNASFHSGQFKINGDNVPVNKWKRCSAQCKLGDDVDFSKNISFYIYGMGFSSNKILYIKNVKLEIGNKSTDFTPAPEDTDNSIQDSKKEVIETLNKAVSTLQLNTDSINASVMSLESTMKNNFNGVQNDIQTIQNKVNLAMTSADVKLEIKKEIEKGTNKVATETGFTFDNNGLRIDKSDSEMATRITENGMTITKNNNVVLTANNQGVDAVNLHATTYLIIGGNSRIEDFGSNRTACFWIGNS